MNKRNRKTPEDMKVGSIHHTNVDGSCEVLSYNGTHSVEIRFVGYEDIIIVSATSLRTGKVKNPMAPKTCSVGFIGIGDYCTAKNKEAYSVWKSMLLRCYDDACQAKQPTYVGCTVCDEWHNFQNFAKWFYGYGNYKEGYQLDKDILKQGNKVYGPDVCIFVHKDINKLFVLRDNHRGAFMLGVDHLPSGKYRAKCSIGAKAKHLGVFDTQEEAHSAYCDFKYAYIRMFASEVTDERIKEALLKYKLPEY